MARVLNVAWSNFYVERKTRTHVVGTELSPAQLVIKELVAERPTYGYRRITALSRRKLGLAVNNKRVYKLMKSHNLLFNALHRVRHEHTQGE